jgi:His-Xaa-Ser system protein HxsD
MDRTRPIRPTRLIHLIRPEHSSPKLQQISSGLTTEILVTVDTAVTRKEAVLKACYWFSRDFSHEITLGPDTQIQVHLRLKPAANPEALARCREDFVNMAIDFELRAQIEEQTAEIRETILAKAFSEAGLLEDHPAGRFADPVEEQKPEGLFKILDSGSF